MTTPVDMPIEAELDNVKYFYFTFEDEQFRVKKKFKRLKFLRLLNTDPIGALGLAFEADDLATLEDREFDEGEFEGFLEIVATTLVGGKGN